MKKVVLNQTIVDLEGIEQYYQTGQVTVDENGVRNAEKKSLLLGTKLVKYLSNARTNSDEEAVSLKNVLVKIIGSFEVTEPVVIETTDEEFAVINSVFSKEVLFIKIAFLNMVAENNPISEDSSVNTAQ